LQPNEIFYATSESAFENKILTRGFILYLSFCKCGLVHFCSILIFEIFCG